MQLLFHPHLRIGEAVGLDTDDSKHLRALRIGPEEAVHMTDGKGHLFRCRLSWEGRTAWLTPEHDEAFSPYTPQLTIGIAPTKNPDRTEWFVEKAVEIGVHAIHFLQCDHSEREQVRMERMERIAIAALKQSQRFWLPALFPPTPFDTFLADHRHGTLCIAHCQDEVAKLPLRDVVRSGQDATILIGPEGDFSRDEIYRAEQAGFRSVSLGQARLRTETAGLAAVHTFSFLQTPQ